MKNDSMKYYRHNEQIARINRLAEADKEVERLKIRVKEAKGRLKAAEAQRAGIAVGCTHKLRNGKPAGEAGLFGNECTICGEKDFNENGEDNARSHQVL